MTDEQPGPAQPAKPVEPPRPAQETAPGESQPQPPEPDRALLDTAQKGRTDTPNPDEFWIKK